MLRLVLSLFLSLSVQAKTLHIAVIDTGFPTFKTNAKICPNGVYDLTGTDIYDKIHHGTNILGIISNKIAGTDYCMYVLKIYDAKSTSTFAANLRAWWLLTQLDYVDIVNYSSEGDEPVLLENILIQKLISKGTIIVAAAGNGNRNLDVKCNAYPACYNNVISVGNLNPNGTRAAYSNYGKRVSEWRVGVNVYANGYIMSGTSQATAQCSGDIALQLINKIYKQAK